jgi:uncharacterized protein (TIGR03435 family)
MYELDDSLLLREYVKRGSEPAFAELVSRHVHKVYSVALRHTRNPHQAEEITQAVFVILARKASKLIRHTALSGWLYQTARLTAVTQLRGEIRRARREQEALMRTSANEAESDRWPQIAPLLDDAMAGLSETDRHAVVLRFFDGKSMGEVGAALGGSESAAKMRVNRAIEKLRKFFSKRGVALPAAALMAAISAHSVQAAPAALAKSVTAIAVVKGAAAPTSTLTLIKGALKLMAWTKAKTTIVAGVIVLLAAGTTTITVKEVQAHRTYPWQAGGERGWFSGLLLNQQPPQVRIVSSTFTNFAEGASGDKLMGTGIFAQGVVAAAYGATSARTILTTDLPIGRYDYIACLAQGNAEALQREVRRKFGVSGRIETRATDVLVLKVSRPNAPGLKGSVSPPGNDVFSMQPNGLRCQNRTLADVCSELEALANIPVLNQTGLTNRFDFELQLDWDLTPGWWKPNANLKRPFVNMDNVNEALLEQLGLELVPTNLPLQVLVVDRAS